MLQCFKILFHKKVSQRNNKKMFWKFNVNKKYQLNIINQRVPNVFIATLTKFSEFWLFSVTYLWKKFYDTETAVQRKRCSENMQQIYRRTPMPKFDFSKVAKQLIEIILWHGCSTVNLLYIFRTPFPKNTSWWLLLIIAAWQGLKYNSANWLHGVPCWL